MLIALLLALLGAPPVCGEQAHFSWPSSSFPGVRDGALTLRTLAWVRASGDAFVIELSGDRVLVGRRAKAPAVSNVEGWKRQQQCEVRLPLAQGGVVVSEAGGGLGCVVMEKALDLGGPIRADVRLDARTKWQFELRDRSMKQVLISF